MGSLPGLAMKRSRTTAGPSINVRLTNQEYRALCALCRHWQELFGITLDPEALLEAFVSDFTQSSRSGGPGAARLAEEWFLRTDISAPLRRSWV